VIGRPSRKVVLRALGVTGLLFVPIWWWGNDLLRGWESDRPSVSHGTTVVGWLERGKRLPTAGPNFRTYSRLGSLLGRTAVHSTVRDILLESYAGMERLRPETSFIYGETGWPTGGRFRPHRGHQNGTSVDFFVPVRDKEGRPTLLPIDPWTEFGYKIEFDTTGEWHGYTVDFPALADHLLLLDSLAAVRGAPISRVILTPDFYDELSASPPGAQALARLPWMKAKPWVRHDEHYHIDFAVPRVP
jgi:penicillin-insensitive murein DD-endopeptidase